MMKQRQLSSLAKSEEQQSFESLPDHVIVQEILTYLHGRDVCALSLTNKRFYQCLHCGADHHSNIDTTGCNLLWKQLLETDFVNMLDQSSSVSSLSRTTREERSGNEAEEAGEGTEDDESRVAVMSGGDTSWITVDYGSNDERNKSNGNSRSSSNNNNGDNNNNNSGKDDHIVQIGERNYGAIYRSRAMEFYHWKRSLYSSRRRHYRIYSPTTIIRPRKVSSGHDGYDELHDDNGSDVEAGDDDDQECNRNLSVVDVALDAMHLLLSYIRILIWMFINPKVQPAYVPVGEAEPIMRKCLDAGSYLITTVMCMSLITCGIVNYMDDEKSYVISNVFIQAWIMFACAIIIKYGSMATPIEKSTELSFFKLVTWVAAFCTSMFALDLMLNNVLLIILSITLALSQSLKPMLTYQNESHHMEDQMDGKTYLANSTLNGTVVAVVFGIGGLKFTFFVFLVIIEALTGGSGQLLSLIQYLPGKFYISRFALGIVCSVVSVILFYVTKWSLLTGGFPKRKPLQRFISWVMLLTLFVSLLSLVGRTLSILIGYNKWIANI